MDTHREAEELLPWYATGQLDASDRALVDAHLSSCAHCQRQLQGERRLIERLQASIPEQDSGWARLLGRIDAPVERRSLRQTLRDYWQFLTRPIVAIFAAAQVIILALAAGLVASMSGPAYVALGDAPAAATSSANIIVMFRPEATEADMREILKASGASLVGGPTAADAYLLQVPARQRPAALAKLGAADDVMMAEPIDGAVR